MKYLLIAIVLLAACNGAKQDQPMTFGKTIESVAKPKRDTINGAIVDHYQRSVTVSWDSAVIVGVVTTPPVVVDPPPADPVTNYGTLVYSLDFSNKDTDLDPFGNNQFGKGSIVDGKFKAVPGSVSAGLRSEVQFPDNLTPTEGVIEYDVMYETVFQNSGHSLQFHPQTSGGSASPGLWHENGRWVWVNWKGGTNTKYPTNVAIPQGKWMHVVFEYKIGSAGYMKFTVDGKVILNKTGIQVGDGSGQYLKVGTNQWVSAPSVVWYDNIKIWRRG